MTTLKQSERPLHPSLQAKLQLLDSIQKGDFKRVSQLSYALSKVGRTNPQLYGKLSFFVQNHKHQRTFLFNKVNQVDSSDDQDEPEIENVDDDFVQGKQWGSDQSIQYESDEEEADKENTENKLMTQKQTVQRRQLFKEVKNLDRRSVSNKKLTPANNTYQFKSPAVLITKKTAQLKPSNSKAQLHRNSAIGKARVALNH